MSEKYIETKEAINTLFIQIAQEYLYGEIGNIAIKKNEVCHKEQIEYFLSLFEQDECLVVKPIMSPKDTENRIFLIDDNTLLRISTSNITMSSNPELVNINYSLSKFNNCKGKVYTEYVLYRHPEYYERHYEKEEVFGLFDDTRRIGTSYKLNDTVKTYNNKDIKDILKVMPIEEINKRINEKRKSLTRKPQDR